MRDKENIVCKDDFTKGSMLKNIVYQAVPLTVAQLVQLLYNIVDRVYIGHMKGVGTLALTGVGLTFPIISIVLAFSRLFSAGGAPLCAIARGAGDNARASRLMGNTLVMLVITGAILTVAGYLAMRPLLFLFGASESTFPYAFEYLQVYLAGTVFVMVGDGMNPFINAQGFPKIGMATIIIGAVLNLVLDPVLIFGFRMGVRGAAIATVISQGVSALWVLWFLRSPYAVLKLKKKDFLLSWQLLRKILALGTSGFVMASTTGAVQIVCNTMLKLYGGDLYIGVMTILNSIREVLLLPMSGLTAGSQPVLGYNYGAGRDDRVKKGIRVISAGGLVYTGIAWMAVLLFPGFFIRIFNNSQEMLQYGIPALKIYFFAVVCMALQVSGQTTFVSLGMSGKAVFFSLLRKVIIVIPLTLLLPRLWGLGVDGIFWAEPISNILGGGAAFITMLLTVYKKLDKAPRKDSRAALAKRG